MQATAGKGAARVRLPPPRSEGEISLEAVLRTRRSRREYGREPLALGEIGQLLWAAQGVTNRHQGLRAAPSAGALYPLESYVLAGRVTGLPAGVYRYRPEEHLLDRLFEGDRRDSLCRAALSQHSISLAPAVLVFAAVFARTTAKYGRRGIRYVYMDLGHATQNLYLQAESLGLGTVFIGAFDDGAVRRVLDLPAGEEPLAVMPVGRR
jgi:SagB-type dehydrogenase family enzyme